MHASKYLWLVALATVSVAIAQETSIRGFANVDYNVSDDAAKHHTFTLGQYDLYITSEVADRVSFLGESVFEWDETVNGFHVDVERVVLKYNWSDYFNVSAGKFHTPIGYWNVTFHHGTVLQPTTRRPLLFFFEDEGGILPIHTTGLLFSGSNIGSAKFGYDFLIGNGIGSTPVDDNDNTKSVTVRLLSHPVDGLEVGVSGYVDKIAANTLSLVGDTLREEVQQSLYNGYAVYFSGPYEFAAEYVHVGNKTAAGGSKGTSGLYVYGGYRFGSLVPYFRYDQLSFASGEPYFNATDTKMTVVGLRYEITILTGLKVEYHNVNVKKTGTSNEFVAQFAVAF